VSAAPSCCAEPFDPAVGSPVCPWLLVPATTKLKGEVQDSVALLLFLLVMDFFDDAGFERWCQDKSSDALCDGDLPTTPSLHPIAASEEKSVSTILPDDELPELCVIPDPVCVNGALLRRVQLTFLKIPGKPELVLPTGAGVVNNSVKSLSKATLSSVSGVLSSSLRLLERQSFLKCFLDLLLDDMIGSK
jgi:hypothetical protein